MMLAFVFVASPAGAEYGDDYPWSDAYEYDKSNYDWRVDENGDRDYNDAGEKMSPMRFGYRNCVDYVAWRLNKALGGSATNIKFDWGSLKFPNGDGNARGWKDGAINSGYTVNDVPALNAVAWWGPTTTNSYGHVGIVGKVISKDRVIVEEYNKNSDGKYGKRELIRGTADWPQAFLHIADQSDTSSSWGGIGDAHFIGTDRLASGQVLRPNQYMLSGDGRFVFMFQGDGNLVIYSGSGAIWSAGTTGKGGTELWMQGDGNLVLYGPSGAVWHTHTGGWGGSTFVMQSDGNAVIYQNGGPATWHTSTGGRGAAISSTGTDRLGPDTSLSPGQYLVSGDGRYRLLLQSDGNVVLYGPGYHVLWHASTGGKGGNRLVMQSDGNLVLYNGSGGAVWHTHTGGWGASTFVMQGDGNAVVYQNGGPATWHTSTGGRI